MLLFLLWDVGQFSLFNLLYVLNCILIQSTGVSEALNKYTDPNVESKGIKAHFRLDESGIVNLDGIEAVFDTKVEESVPSENFANVIGDAFAKFGPTISKFFGRSEENETATETETVPETPVESENKTATKEADKVKESSPPESAGAEKKEETKETTESPPATGEKGNQTDAEKTVTSNDTVSSNATAINETASNTTTEIKTKTIKEPIVFKQDYLDLPIISIDRVKEVLKKLTELDVKEAEKLLRDQTKNNLESFILGRLFHFFSLYTSQPLNIYLFQNPAINFTKQTLRPRQQAKSEKVFQRN